MAVQQIGLEAILDLGKFTPSAKAYENTMKRLGKVTGDFDKQTAGFGTQITKNFQNVGKVVLGASAAIAAAGVAAGVAIGKFTVDGIRKAADLESQMSRIAATLNTTREAAAPLKDLIMQLALDPKLVVTTNEAADAIENLAKNGVSMKDILDGVARSVVLLANSTGAEFGAAADVVTDVMAQFNLTAQDTEHAVNQITGVTNLSKLTFDDYRLAIAQAGGAAGMLGVSFEDFNSVLIATNANFASGSDLGTSFKNFLTTLPGKSDKAKEAIAALGLEFFDAQGNMRSMAEISEELNQAFMHEVEFSTQVSNMTAEQTAQKKLLEQQIGSLSNQLLLYEAGVNGVGESEEANAEAVAKLNQQHAAAMGAYEGLAASMGTTVTVRRNLTEEERIAYAQTIFGVDSMRLAFGMAEAGEVAYTDLATATKALGLEGKQLAIAQESLSKAFEDGKITMFEFGTAQAAAIDASAQAAERMRNFKGVMDILGGAIEGLQIMIGDAFLPVLTVLANKANDLVAAYGPNLVKPFQDFGKALTEFFTSLEEGQTPLDAFKDAMATFGPKGTEVANAMIGIGLALGGVWLAVKLVLQPIIDTIAKFVEWQDVLIVLAGAVTMVVGSIVGPLLLSISGIALTIGGAILAVAALRTAWENDWLGIQTKTTEAVTAIQAAFAPLTESIRQHGQGALAEIQAFASGNETEWTNVKAIWEGAKESVTNLFSSIVGTVLLNYPIWWATLQLWGTTAGQWILDAAATVGTHIATYTTALITEITNKLPEWSAKLTEWSTAAGEWLTTASTEVGAKLGEWYTALSTALGGKLASWMVAFNEWTTAAWNWLVTASLLVGAKVGEWYTNLSATLAAKLPEWTAAFLEWIKATWQWLVDSVPLVTAKIGEWYTALSGAVGGKLASWMTVFDEWTTEAWNWLVTASTLIVAKVGEWYTALSGEIAAKLPTWKTAFTEWITAAWQWIVDSAALLGTKIGEWYTSLTAGLGTKLVSFGTEMLKWATKLVSWIGSTAADALPELGKWLGKIVAWTVLGAFALAINMAKFAVSLVGWIASTAADALPELGKWFLKIINWIPGAVTDLTTAIVDLAGALIGWINGTGETDPNSAAGKLAAEFEKFKTALGAAIDQMWEGIKGFVQEFGQSFWDTLGVEINWSQLGMDIITAIWSGIDTMKSLVTGTFKFVAQEAYDLIFNTDWLGLGMKTVLAIKDGAVQMGSVLWRRLKGIAQDAYDKFLEVDWLQLGKDVIAGIKKGLEAKGQEIVTYITGLGQQALDSILGLFGIESPSKVFIEVGKNIIQGWLVGLQTGSVGLVIAAEQIAKTFTNTILKGTERAVDAFANILDSWSSVGSGFADTMQTALDSVTESFNNMLATGTGTGAQQWDMIRLMSQLQTGLGKYQSNNRTLETLKQQAELINLIRESGGQPATVLAGIALGRDADPQQLLDVVNRMMETFNGRLEDSIKIAAQGFQELVDSLRSNRRTIEQVEAQFADDRIDQLERYKREVLRLDEEILRQEQILLTRGNQAAPYENSPLANINQLNNAREQMLNTIRQFLEQNKRLEATIATAPVFRTERAQAGAAAFRERFIDPLVAAFGNQSVAQREQTLQQIDRYLGMLRDYETRMQNAGAAMKGALKAAEGFGDTAQQRIENLLAVIYDVGTPTASRDNAIQTLRDFAASLNAIRTELTTRGAGRETTESIIERATGGFDQLAAYKTAIADLDKRIQSITDTIEETGNVSLLPQLRSLDVARNLSTDELKNFLVQVSQLEGAFRAIKNLTGPGETSAQRFVDEQIQPILDAFSAPMRPVDREAWLRTARERVALVNRFIDQMRAVEKLQLRIADQEGFAHLSDEFAAMADIAMPEAQRVALLNQLTAYISQMERLFALQKDISVGVGADPLVERFRSERLDTIAKQLENINLSEAERVRLIEQYRMEQEKILAIQTKQNQLEFLQQQLSLLDKVNQLAKEEGFKVDVPNIIRGIGFGVNASMDDLLALVGRVIDETVRFTNFKLGIKSPSRVFAEIGGYMMQGLARGIEGSMMRPINSLSGAISELPYALGGRSLTLNMGGVNISNGMDEVMFEARVRQILDRAFP